MKIVFVILALAALVLIGLFIWRQLDHRADRIKTAQYIALQPSDPPLFAKNLVQDLPDPARRYFEFSIAKGAPLYSVAEITMTGQFGMGTQAAPNYMPMRAQQVLAAPDGLLWKMSGGAGLMRISGSDSAQWTRFWVAGLVPVARAGGTSDHLLSAFGRAVAEAVIWTPAALLPRQGVAWEALNDTTARVTITHEGLTQAVDVTVDADGRPRHLVLQRWSNANPEGVWQFQPFGGTLSAFQEFERFRIATHVEAGNFFGTGAYFPFFIADVSDVKFARLTGR